MRKHTKAWIISKLNSLRVNNTRLLRSDCFAKVIKASRMSLAVYLYSPAVVNLWHFHQKLELSFRWSIKTFNKFLKHTFSLVRFFFPVKDFAGRGVTLNKVVCKSEPQTLFKPGRAREKKLFYHFYPYWFFVIIRFRCFRNEWFCSRNKHVDDIFLVSKACQSNCQRVSMLSSLRGQN